MDVFFTGLIVLAVMTAIFYIVFGSFIYYWHLTGRTYVVVPVIFAFEVFLRGFLALVIISLIFYFAPYLINYLGS